MMSAFLREPSANLPKGFPLEILCHAWKGRFWLVIVLDGSWMPAKIDIIDECGVSETFPLHLSFKVQI
jgi:hypothetical protein